ncbi:hypothetical protein [Marinobacter sp.]|uniref:hypothetical protein n=1 Tax=Marinobacter sp. TaxID=50741 RepID=UPI00384C61DE
MSRRSVRLHLSALAKPEIGLRRAAEVAGVNPVGSARGILSRYRSSAVFWRGFRHTWGYNHRVNRFASFVRDLRRSDGDAGEAVVGHGAASGSGPDTLDFEDYCTRLTATGVFFQSENFQYRITTLRGVTSRRAVRLEVKLEGPMRFCDTFAVVLGGYDLCSLEDSEKLVDFRFRVLEPQREQDVLSLTLDVEFTGHCRSLECEDHVDVVYDADFHFLIVGGTPDTLNVVASTQSGQDGWAETSYDWDTDHEVRREKEGQANVRFEDVWPADTGVSVIAFNALETRLDKEAHMLEWTTAIRELRPQGTAVEGDLTLFFKNWTAGMQGEHRPESLFAFRAGGSATLSAGTTLLQFRAAEHHKKFSHAGRIQWRPAQHGSPCGDDAERLTRFTVP